MWHFNHFNFSLHNLEIKTFNIGTIGKGNVQWYGSILRVAFKIFEKN